LGSFVSYWRAIVGRKGGEGEDGGRERRGDGDREEGGREEGRVTHSQPDL
jgi:hypothetical protein